MRQPGSGHPPFATFDVEDVDKADGRKVHYYTWPAAADGEPEAGAAHAEPRSATPGADVTPSAQPDRV